MRDATTLTIANAKLRSHKCLPKDDTLDNVLAGQSVKCDGGEGPDSEDTVSRPVLIVIAIVLTEDRTKSRLDERGQSFISCQDL